MDGAVDIIMLILQRIDAEANAIERPKLPGDVLNEVQRKYMCYAISETYHLEWGKQLVQMSKAYECAGFISMAKRAFSSAEQVMGETAKDRAAVDTAGPETLVQEALLDAEQYRWQKKKDGLGHQLEKHIADISKRLKTRPSDQDAGRECALLSRTLGYIYQQLGKSVKADECYTKAVEYGYSGHFPHDHSFDEDRYEVSTGPHRRNARRSIRRALIALSVAPEVLAGWIGLVVVGFGVAVPFLFDIHPVLKPFEGTSLWLLVAGMLVGYVMLGTGLAFGLQALRSARGPRRGDDSLSDPAHHSASDNLWGRGL